MARTLTDISGIGKAAAVRMTDAGFTTVEDVAAATTEALGKVQGFGPTRAAQVIEIAKAMIEPDAPVESTEEKPKAVVEAKKEAADVTAEEVKAEAAPKAGKKAAKVAKVEEKTAKTGAKVEKKANDDAKVEKKADETVKADPVVAAVATGRFAAAKSTVSKPKVFLTAAAILVLAGIAGANQDAVVGYYDTAVDAVTTSLVGDPVAEAKATVVAATPAAKPVQAPVAPAMIAKPVAMPQSHPVRVAAPAAPIAAPATQATAPNTVNSRPIMAPNAQRPVMHPGFTRLPVGPFAPRPYYPANSWGNGPWNGNGMGNGAANGGFSMGFSGKSNVAGNGYGYNRPYYGAPYGTRYAYPRPMGYRMPAAAPTKTSK